MQDGADRAEADDDFELRTRIAEGDHIAFRSLVERYLDPMLSLSHRLIGDRTLSERLVEDAMLEIWKIGAGWLNHDEPIKYWLYRRVTGGSFNLAQPSGSSAPALVSEGAPNLDAALAQFPVRQRAALILSLGEGLAAGDIAEILQVDDHLLEKCLKDGRVHLRRSLRAGSHKGFS